MTTSMTTSRTTSRATGAIQHLSDMVTEQQLPASGHLDEMSVRDIAFTMNDTDFSVPSAIRRALPAIADAIEAAVPRFSGGGRLIYVGAGTSGRLGVLDASECPPTFHTAPGRVVGIIAGGLRALVDAVEGAEDDLPGGTAVIGELNVGPEDTVVGLAASGRTPYVIGALQEARERGAVTISVSCNSPAELSAVAAYPIEVTVGPEVITGSTRLKSGSAQKQVINMISTALMVRSGRTYGNLMVEMRATNDKLRRRAIGMVAKIAQVDQRAAEQALDAADGEVKAAVVMHYLGVGFDEAHAALDAVGGRLGEAIGIPSTAHPAFQ